MPWRSACSCASSSSSRSRSSASSSSRSGSVVWAGGGACSAARRRPLRADLPARLRAALTSGTRQTQVVADRPAARGGSGAAGAPASATPGVTTALIVATAAAARGGAAAAQPFADGTLAGRLVEQLGSLGITDVRVLTRPAFADGPLSALGRPVLASPSLTGDLRAVEALAREAPGDVVVIQGEIL